MEKGAETKYEEENIYCDGGEAQEQCPEKLWIPISKNVQGCAGLWATWEVFLPMTGGVELEGTCGPFQSKSLYDSTFLFLTYTVLQRLENRSEFAGALY